MVRLARGKSHLIERIRLWNLANTESVREFRIDVSDTAVDESAFTTVLTATALNQSTSFQDFVLPGGPVAARYVRFVVVSNYNSTSYVGIRELQVVPVAQAPQRTYSSALNASTRPEMAARRGRGTGWVTASGQVTDQYL